MRLRDSLLLVTEDFEKQCWAGKEKPFDENPPPADQQPPDNPVVGIRKPDVGLLLTEHIGRATAWASHVFSLLQSVVSTNKNDGWRDVHGVLRLAVDRVYG